MQEMPEFSVGCFYPNGRPAGQCFDKESDARDYFRDCVASGRYASVALFDAVDNKLAEWMSDD
jgi:hypothetical protein